MTVSGWTEVFDVIEDVNIHTIAMTCRKSPCGTELRRGQVFISPKGLAKARKWLEGYPDNED